MKKTVIVYANYAAPYEGNFFSSQKLLALELSKKEIETIFVLPQVAKEFSWVDNLETKYSKVVYQPAKSKDRIRLFKVLLRENDIIFIHTHFIPVGQILEIKRAMFGSKKTVIVEHFHNHYTQNTKIKEYFKHQIMRNDYFLGCSKDVCDHMKKIGIKNQCDYVENAIDFSRLDKVNSIDLKNEKYSVLIFGFDYYRKGVDVALNAANILNKENVNVQLYICLSTNEEFVIEEIKRRFGKVPEWVSILPPRNDIATYYSNMDVFISPSREEGFCYSIIEAAYCKTICIASNISGQRKADMDGIFWCEANSVDSLVNCIKQTIEMTSEKRDTIENKLKNEAIEGYGISNWVNKMIKIYKGWKLL